MASSSTLRSFKKIVDLSGQALKSVELSEDLVESTTIIFDNNEITDFAILSACRKLQKLSLVKNNIFETSSLSRFSKLQVLNLSDNAIQKIEGFSRLVQLEWLNLSGNQIKTIENLRDNVLLKHLDLSFNRISELGDLSDLVHLKTFLIQGNMLETLNEIPAHLSPSISTLSLADNKLEDLTEMQLLGSLPFLESLSISGNPCLSDRNSGEHSAKVLDAEGHLKLLHPGEHSKLAKYLLEASPAYSAKSSKKSMVKEKDSEEGTSSSQKDKLNSSLLESESIYLPVIYESPPKKKRSNMPEFRPPSAPPHFDLRSITWKDLFTADVNGNILEKRTTSWQGQFPEHRTSQYATPSKDEVIRPSTAPQVADTFKHGYIEKEATVQDQHEAASAAVSVSDRTSVSMTAEEAVRLLNLAAAMIQAYVRGFLQRRKYQTFMKRFKAATKIQAAWRGYYTRCLDFDLINTRKDQAVIQLSQRVNVLESDLQRLQAEKDKDKSIMAEIFKIMMQEINTQRDQLNRLEQSKENVSSLCRGLQTEIYHLKSMFGNPLPADVSKPPAILTSDSQDGITTTTTATTTTATTTDGVSEKLTRSSNEFRKTAFACLGSESVQSSTRETAKTSLDCFRMSDDLGLDANRATTETVLSDTTDKTVVSGDDKGFSEELRGVVVLTDGVESRVEVGLCRVAETPSTNVCRAEAITSRIETSDARSCPILVGNDGMKDQETHCVKVGCDISCADKVGRCRLNETYSIDSSDGTGNFDGSINDGNGPGNDGIGLKHIGSGPRSQGAESGNDKNGTKSGDDCSTVVRSEINEPSNDPENEEPKHLAVQKPEFVFDIAAYCHSELEIEKLQSVPVSEQHKQWRPRLVQNYIAEPSAADERDSKETTGHNVIVDPTGHNVDADPTGHNVDADPTGHNVDADPTGHNVDVTEASTACAEKNSVTSEFLTRFDAISVDVKQKHCHGFTGRRRTMFPSVASVGSPGADVQGAQMSRSFCNEYTAKGPEICGKPDFQNRGLAELGSHGPRKLFSPLQVYSPRLEFGETGAGIRERVPDAVDSLEPRNYESEDVHGSRTHTDTGGVVLSSLEAKNQIRVHSDKKTDATEGSKGTEPVLVSSQKDWTEEKSKPVSDPVASPGIGLSSDGTLNESSCNYDTEVTNVRTSTPVKKCLGVVEASPDDIAVNKPVSVDKKAVNQNRALHDVVPECLSSMPLIVPLVKEQRTPETQRTLPLFVDQSFESANTSFEH
eukprot:gene186-799_t